MSAPAWTPGPWRVHVEPGSGVSWSSNSVFVCGPGSWPEEQVARVNVQDGLEEREANARLIAAAPDMAETGAAYWAAVDAKREFERDHPNNTTKAWDDLLYAVEAAEAAHRAALAKAGAL